MVDFHFLASGLIRIGPIRSGGAAAAFPQISLEISNADSRHVLTACTGPIIDPIRAPASIALQPRLSGDPSSLRGLLSSSTDDLDTIIGILRR
jgi:hypothetical protein